MVHSVARLAATRGAKLDGYRIVEITQVAKPCSGSYRLVWSQRGVWSRARA